MFAKRVRRFSRHSNSPNDTSWLAGTQRQQTCCAEVQDNVPEMQYGYGLFYLLEAGYEKICDETHKQMCKVRYQAANTNESNQQFAVDRQHGTVKMTAPILQVKKLSPAATLPSRATPGSAGYDLYASRATTIPSKGKVIVPTDISIALPEGTYGRIAPYLFSL